jgi:large subunit ribosomal protein L25
MTTKHKATKVEMTATPRAITGDRVRHLRAEGQIPAVLYGKGMDAVNLQVDARELAATLKIAGESTLVYLSVGKESYPVIIHDVHRDPLKGSIVHADFYKVRLDEKIKTMVPVVFTGESAAVKDLKGIFVRNVNEVEVEALPQDLPHEVTVDISAITALGQSITLADIKVPKATLVGEPGEIICTVTEPMSEEELKASLEAPTVDVSAVEEIKKEEKPAEEGEEAAEEAPKAE